MRFTHSFLAVLTFTLISCAGESENTESQAIEENFNFTGMMANYADNIIIPTYKSFSQAITDANTSESALNTYCNDIGSENEATRLAAAQSQWRDIMAIWQQAELFIVGPAAQNGNAQRNAIFSYASNFPPSRCAVDQSVVLNANSNFNVTSRSFNSRGLDALEYLLFNTNLEHTCPIQITETQTWNARPELERKQLRCAYAQTVLSDLQQSADTLLQSWELTGSDFRTTFVNPVNLPESLSALSDGLFYIELETKDTKLGLPTGIQSECGQTACPAAIESPFSENSLENIRNNLLGFQKIFNGANGLGFDDIINDSGFSQVTTQFNNDVNAAITFIDSIDSSLLMQSEALLASGDNSACLNSAANPDTDRTVPICSLHGLLKRITDSLRVEFITIVNLDLPSRGQSDND